jgi:hypothetical protein
MSSYTTSLSPEGEEEEEEEEEEEVTCFKPSQMIGW